jgi:hypothetical protein
MLGHGLVETDERMTRQVLHALRPWIGAEVLQVVPVEHHEG